MIEDLIPPEAFTRIDGLAEEEDHQDEFDYRQASIGIEDQLRKKREKIHVGTRGGCQRIKGIYRFFTILSILTVSFQNHVFHGRI